MAERTILGSPAAKIAWVLSGAVCLFAAENLWIDEWVVRRSRHRVPSLVPEALGGSWSLVLTLLAIAVVLAVVSQVLVTRDKRLTFWRKALTGIVVLAAVGLASAWVATTSGAMVGLTARVEAALPQNGPKKPRAVTLHWLASSTKNARYNVYRGTTQGLHPDRLNSEPIDGLSFTDSTVQSGTTYYYVTRAVDTLGKESIDSNETMVQIP